jgi:hypothetical protein
LPGGVYSSGSEFIRRDSILERGIFFLGDLSFGGEHCFLRIYPSAEPGKKNGKGFFYI